MIVVPRFPKTSLNHASRCFHLFFPGPEQDEDEYEDISDGEESKNLFLSFVHHLNKYYIIIRLRRFASEGVCTKRRRTLAAIDALSC